MGDDTKYTQHIMTAKSFLPHGKYVNGNGDVEELGREPMLIPFEGSNRELLAVVPAEGILECCPLCEGDIHEGAIVVITDSHNLFPCWECNKLVEQLIEIDLDGLE